MLIERKLIMILNFTRFSGKGHHTLHYEKSQNMNFLALVRSCILFYSINMVAGLHTEGRGGVHWDLESPIPY